MTNDYLAGLLIAWCVPNVCCLSNSNVVLVAGSGLCAHIGLAAVGRPGGWDHLERCSCRLSSPLLCAICPTVPACPLILVAIPLLGFIGAFMSTCLPLVTCLLLLADMCCGISSLSLPACY